MGSLVCGMVRDVTAGWPLGWKLVFGSFIIFLGAAIASWKPLRGE